MGCLKGNTPGGNDWLRDWTPPSNLDDLRKIPWWILYARNLVKRFDYIQQLGSIAVDGKPPPKNLWLNDDAIDKWQKNQIALKSQPNENV